MTEAKQRKPGVHASVKAEGGYFNCNIFMGAKKDGTPVMSVGVNTPDKQTGFTNLVSKTSANGKPYLSGVVTIGETKSLVKVDQIKTEDHNFLVLGVSRIGGTAEAPTFTSVSAKGASLYANDLAKGSDLDKAFRETFTDLPADTFDYHPREAASVAAEDQTASSTQKPAAAPQPEHEESFDMDGPMF